MLYRGALTAGLAVLCTLWAALTAAKISVRRCQALQELQSLIAFPCMLMYGAFAMLSLY